MFYRIVFYLFLCSRVLPAQHIQISVFDARDLQPLAGTCIIISGDTLLTDDGGTCVISTTPLSLIVERDDYYAVQINSVPSDSFSVYLQPAEFAPVIKVVSPSYEKPLFLPASTAFITLSKERKAQALSLNEILKDEAGISFKSYGGGGQLQVITLRGHSAEQTQVLFDGIPMNNLQLGLLNFSTLSASQAGHVEVYKGGSPLYGGSGAIGGSINVLPRSLADKTTADFSFNGSSLNNKTLSVGLGLPLAGVKQNFNFEAASGENDYKVQSGGRQVTLRNRDYNSQNILWQAGYDFSDDFSADLLIKNYSFKGGSPDPFTGALSEINNSPRISYDNTLARIRFEGKLSRGLVNFQLYRKNDWNRYRNPDNNVNSLHFNYESGALLRGRYAFSSGILLNSGAEFARQGIHSSDAGEQQRDRYAVYALTDFLLYDTEDSFLAWHLNLSSRFEKMMSENIFLPGAGVTLEFNNFSIFMSVAANHRTPSFNELYWPGLGDEDLKPEQSVIYEAGISHKQRMGAFSLNNSLTIYQSSVRNQIKWLPDTRGDFIPNNILEISSEGIELTSDIRWHEFLQLNLDYSYGDAYKTKKEFAGDHTKGNRVPYTALHNLYINGVVRYRDFMIGAGWDFKSYRYTTFANDNFLPAVGILSIKSGYTLRWYDTVSSSLYLFVENLTDKNYQLYAGYPMPPRTYKLNLTITY